jgi:hypothetical protein
MNGCGLERPEDEHGGATLTYNMTSYWPGLWLIGNYSQSKASPNKDLKMSMAV